MKLLYCTYCGHIFNLALTLRSCECKRTEGFYIDFLNAQVKGPCIVLGIQNQSFKTAKEEQKTFGDLPNAQGREFIAFVIPDCAPSVRRVK